MDLYYNELTPLEQRRRDIMAADPNLHPLIRNRLLQDAPPSLTADDDFSLKEFLWQRAIPGEGIQFADRVVGRPYYAEGAGLSVGDFAGGGLVDMIDAASRASSTGSIRGEDAMNVGFGLLETIPGLALLRSSLRRGATPVGEAAANTYRVGQRLAEAGGYTGLSGRPSVVGMPGGERFNAMPISEIEQATLDYLNRRGMDASPMTEYPPFSEERARLIAAAYDQMPHSPNDPTVRRAYDAMIQETLDQYNALRDTGIDFRFLQPGMEDPYAASPALGYRDLIENGRLFVFPTDFGFGSDTAFDVAENPLLVRVGQIGDKPDAVANDAFRAVHDTFGHFGPGNPFFRHQGEERAFLEHSRMYSPEARGAMTSETRGQNSWLNFGPYGEQNRTALGADTIFADQKTGLLPSWATDPTGMPDPEQERVLRGLLDRWGR
jgi:hypothetical protein